MDTREDARLSASAVVVILRRSSIIKNNFRKIISQRAGTNDGNVASGTGADVVSEDQVAEASVVWDTGRSCAGVVTKRLNFKFTKRERRSREK